MEYKEADQDFDRAIFFLERKVARAAREFGFLNEGDHILVGLSGGKDSTVLLATLAMRQAWRKERYFLQACHVRGPLNERSSAGEDTERFLRALCERFGVQLHVVDADPLPPAEAQNNPVSLCFLCSRRRRKALFETAVSLGCRFVALGHHMDDVAETLLLNLLWQGRCDGMMPKVSMFGGLVTIIRPFFYIEEKDLTRACRLGSFPVRSCSCQYAMHSHRELAGSLLEQVRRAGVRGVAANLARVTLRHPPNPRES